MALDVSSGSSDRSSSSSRGSGRRRQKLDVETIRLHASSLVARLQSRVRLDTLRPLPMFIGVNPVGSASYCLSSEAFTPPIKRLDKSSSQKVKSRVSLNLSFFLTNYVLLASVVGITVALMHPKMLFYLAIVYLLWACHSFLLKNEFELFGIPLHSILSIQQRFYVLFVITSFVVIWHCLKPTIIFLVISAGLILSHAFLRDPKHIESMDTVGDSDDDDDRGNLRRDEDEGANSGASSSGSGSEVLVERPNRSSRGDIV